MPLELVQLGRHRVDLGAKAGRCLVNEVDRLVGEEPVGYVPVGEHGRGNDRRVLDPHPMVDLISLA